MAGCDKDENEYHGDDEFCQRCQTDKIDHNGAWFCAICDNPDQGEGTWFTAWGNTWPGAHEEDVEDGEAQPPGDGVRDSPA